jgi:hypothetical protein
MSFKRYYPTKDTFIANFDPPSVGSKDISNSNMGASEILNLYKTVDKSATASILLDFNPIGLPNVVPHQMVLKLFDAQHSETIPTDCNVVVSFIEQAWTEGAGHDLDYYTDTGYANWNSATLSTTWLPTTGTSSASFYLSTGHEDLEIDITTLATESFGFKLSIAETGSDYYIKKFHSRHTHFPTKKPFIEVRAEDFVGALTTSSFLMGTTGTFSGTVIPPWANALSASMSAVLVHVTNSIVDPPGELVAHLDVSPVYFSEEVVDLHLTVRSKDYNPATVATASADAPGTVLMDAYYRVVNERTGEVVVPYGTGTVKYTKLSWDDYGNYFRIYMNSLPTGTLMRFDFIYNINGTTSSLPGNDFTFRII